MSETSSPKPKGKRVPILLASLAVAMLGLSFAAVPMYNWFCRVTGWGGVTQVAETGSAVILDKKINIRFDASLERGMPWEFKPVVREMELHIGETGLAFFEAYNPTDHAIAGTASYNVVPFSAGSFFNKIACFCFDQQILQPGQRVQMPVTFYVDPEIVNDPDAKHAKTITLSYTFHVTEMPEQETALVSGEINKVN